MDFKFTFNPSNADGTVMFNKTDRVIENYKICITDNEKSRSTFMKHSSGVQIFQKMNYKISSIFPK